MSIRFANLPFVGRTEELRTLRTLLPGSSSKSGRFIAIAGEPGIGKTRLMSEIANIAAAEGDRILWSQMGENFGAPPFFCWTLALRDYVQQFGDDVIRTDIGSGAPDIADILPDIRDRFGIDLGSTGSSRSGGHYPLFDAVTRLLLAVARREPLIVLLDNLHAADRSSLMLLEYLCQQIAGSPILIIGAYRYADFDRRNPLRSLLAQLSRTPGFHQFSLRGLSLDEVALMLSTRVGSPVPSSLVKSIHERSDGSPLFISEMANMLSQPDSLRSLNQSNDLINVPASLRDVINVRLDALGADTLKTLGVAAVLGRDFDASVLVDLAELPREQVYTQLDQAEEAGIITACRLDRFSFRHASFREVLYREHSTVVRVRLHRRAGELLESHHSNEEAAYYSRLAHHFFEATQVDNGEKALIYCRRAAEEAARRRAFAEAVAMYERALQVVEFQHEPNPETRFDLLFRVGQAQFSAGELNAATQSLMKSAIVAYRERWWVRLADALFAYQFVCQQCGFRHIASIPLHQLALEHIPDESHGVRARTLVSLAKAHRTAGNPDLAESAFRSGVEVARRCADPRILLDCLRKGNWTVGRLPSSIREGLEISREALELARLHESREAVIDSLIDVVFQLCDLGEVDEVEQLLAEILDLAQRERQPHYLNVLAGFETSVAILRGKWLDAYAKAQKTLKQIPVQGVLGLEGRYGFQLFSIKRAQGQLDQMREIANAILATGAITRFWLPGQIMLHCELEQYEHARESLQQLGDLRKLPKDDLYVTSLIYLAESCVALRDKARCSQIYELLMPYRPLNATLPGTLMLGAISGYLGSLAATIQCQAEASSLFEEAIAMNTAMRALPFLARTQVDYARLLLACDNPDAHLYAQQLVAAAKPVASKLNLLPVQNAIAGLQETSSIESLTRREVDILRVVAVGLSNKRIADTLHISLSTVTTHMRNIFRKTGVQNRTEAAEFARRAGLLEQN